MLILPVFLPVAHRSFGIYDYFLCLYKIACTGILILWGLPGQAVHNKNAVSYSCIIIGSPGLSVIPPPLHGHCAAALSIFAPWREWALFSFSFHFFADTVFEGQFDLD